MIYNERRLSGDQSLPGGGREVFRSPAPGISVVLADDHEVLRQGLHALLAMERDISVVGEAGDGRQAVEMAEEMRPDVVVMDIAMPRLNGIEATRQILETVPATRVLVLSAHDFDGCVRRVMGVGASGYVLKQRSVEDLAVAIRAVCAGRTWVSPEIPWHDHSRVRWAESTGNWPPATIRLTSRETEVLQLVAESRSNKEIARGLGISVKTVEKHRQSLMTKLDLHDVAGLTRYAVATGRAPVP